MTYTILSKYRSELMGGAMLWVMLFHAADLDMGLQVLELFRAAGFGGVDIFILLSAMGLSMSLSKKEQDYAAFMARRAGRLLPAYYAVMLPYTLFLILAQDAPWSALIWNSSLLYYWVRSAGGFNWYVAGAMTFYAVTPLCLRALRSSTHRATLAAAGIGASLLACQLLVQEGYWYVTDFFYRVPVFFLGLLMGLYAGEQRQLGRADVRVWAASLGLGAIYLIIHFTENTPILFPLCHLFLFTTVPLCLLACLCFEWLPLGWLQRFLRLVGKHSLEIYLLNVSVFSQTELLHRVVYFGPSNRIYFLFLFAANITLGVGLHWAIARLRRNKQPEIII
ncbi:MAG: acyltransferase [Clostridium sp.]|nr:acyltransferase [Clostridium sp.]